MFRITNVEEVVTVEGEVDQATECLLRRVLADVLRLRRMVIADLSEFRRMDRRGVEALVAAAQVARSLGLPPDRVVVRNPNQRVLDLLERSGLLGRLRVELALPVGNCSD